MPALTQAARDYENALIQNRQLQAAAEAERLKKAKLDVEKAQEESLAGRAALGETLAMIQERNKQAEQGVEIGPDVSRQVLAPTTKGGIGLLEGTRMQSEIDLRKRMEQGRLGAIQQYGIEKGILPTAKIDVGGVSATVPFESAGGRMSDAYGQVYKNMVPRVAQTFIDQGYAPEDANRMAIESVSNQLQKASTTGKVVISSANGLSTISYSNEQAMRMWKDPKTPKVIKAQLDGFFGPSEAPKASDWVKSQTGR